MCLVGFKALVSLCFSFTASYKCIIKLQLGLVVWWYSNLGHGLRGGHEHGRITAALGLRLQDSASLEFLSVANGLKELATDDEWSKVMKWVKRSRIQTHTCSQGASFRTADDSQMFLPLCGDRRRRREGVNSLSPGTVVWSFLWLLWEEET